VVVQVVDAQTGSVSSVTATAPGLDSPLDREVTSSPERSGIGPLPVSEQPRGSEFATTPEGSRARVLGRDSGGVAFALPESRAEKVGAGLPRTELEQRSLLFNRREGHRVGERKVVCRDASTASRLKQQRGPPAEKRGGWGILSQNRARKGGPAGPPAPPVSRAIVLEGAALAVSGSVSFRRSTLA
jgi:hypothetical protein